MSKDYKPVSLDRPRIEIDFNERIADDLYLLSKTDVREDSAGKLITLEESLPVYVFVHDCLADGTPDNLIADGVAELNREQGWSSHVKWCIRVHMDRFGHQSELVDSND